MKGQERAMMQMQSYINGVVRQNRLLQPILIHGPSGVGKSFLGDELERELIAEGFETHKILDPMASFRLVDECKDNFVPLLNSFHKTAIFIDECQNAIPGSVVNGLSNPVRLALRSLIFSNGQAVQRFLTFSLGPDCTTVVDFSKILFVFMTNEPTKLETSGSNRQGEFPFRRRMYNITLEKYKQEVIYEVIEAMVEKRGLRINDCCKGIISRFHRGTLEALSTVLNQYENLYPGVKNITKDNLLAAAKLTDFYPRGLMRKEVEMLSRLQSLGGTSLIRNMESSLGINSSGMKTILSYLAEQMTNGKSTPFLIERYGKITITSAGSQYLETLRREKFIF